MEITALETLNSFPGQWCCANGGYIYGTGLTSRKFVYRKTETGQNFETRSDVSLLDPAFRIENRIYSTTTRDLIFVLVKNDLDNHYLLKSSDGGSTLKNVFTFGEGNGTNGTNTPLVRLLRGILELTRDLPSGTGKGSLFIGEYNVNGKRVRGSVNDRVRIMRSEDNGDTWTKIVEWNTNGTNQVGHIHAMKQDPYTGDIYICTGDDNLKAGIIVWDGVSSWQDNKTLQEIGRLPGFRVLTGSQRYRVCDVLFDENYFYSFTDTQAPNNQNGTESGIWRGKKDLSEYRRMDNQIYDYDPMHIGWFGEKIGNTFIFTTGREYLDPANTYKKLNTEIYTSTDGVHWYADGMLGWKETGNVPASRYITNVFTLNSKLYLDCTEAAGHSSTIQCSLARQWKTNDDPVVLHPVYYVGNWNVAGNDANSGRNADAPKKTLNDLLTSDRICPGARVRISAGTFTAQDIGLQWSNPVFQGRGPVVIEGMGMDETHIRGEGTSGALILETAKTLTGPDEPLILRDLEIYMSEAMASQHTSYVINNLDSYVKTVSCRIGSTANDLSPLIYLASSGSKYCSDNSVHISNANISDYKTIVSSGASGTSFFLKNCIIMNACNAFVINQENTEFSFKNCTFHDLENTGVLIEKGWTVQPVIKNCIFECGNAPLTDLTGMTETEIDFNLYNKPNVNISDGTHNLSIGTDAGFSDVANHDFSLRSDSPCTMAGTYLSDVVFDFMGKERNNPPCIGAYETSGMLVPTHELILTYLSGSSAELNILSNTSWNISSPDSWISLSTISGNGSGIIVVTSTASNLTDAARTTMITITGGGISPVNIIITQLPGALSSENINKNGVKIYPVPASGSLTIEYNDDRFSHVDILTPGGVIIQSEKVEAPVQTIDLSRFKNGLYVLELKQGNETRKLKFIVAH